MEIPSIIKPLYLDIPPKICGINMINIKSYHWGKLNTIHLNTYIKVRSFHEVLPVTAAYQKNDVTVMSTHIFGLINKINIAIGMRNLTTVWNSRWK